MLSTSSSLSLSAHNHNWHKNERGTILWDSVFEMSNAFLQYNTDAAATTFVVNAPVHKF